MSEHSLVTAERINEFLAEQFAGSGNTCEAVGDGWATALIHPGPSNLRPGGIISGPTVFGACDAALYYACFTRIGIEPMTLTSELSRRAPTSARGPAKLATCPKNPLSPSRKASRPPSS